MNVSRTEKGLVGLGAIELIALGSYVFGFLSGPLALILFILGNVAWVAVMRLTHPRLQHLPPLERLGLAAQLAASTRRSPTLRPTRPMGPRTAGGTRAPRPVEVPTDPEEQAALAAERREREQARLAERERIRKEREEAKAVERERRKAERAEADAARRAAAAEKAERDRVEAEQAAAERAEREAAEEAERQARTAQEAARAGGASSTRRRAASQGGVRARSAAGRGGPAQGADRS